MAMHAVLKVKDLPHGKGTSVEVQGLRLAVFNIQGTFYAIDDLCTHAEASLSEGGVLEDECIVECPWHGAQFCLKTGAAKTLPAVEPVKTYKVYVQNDDVMIEV